MGDIQIGQDEILHLCERIKRKFFKERPDIAQMQVWNSNPDNYKDLRESIQKLTGQKLGLRFLRSFFYDTLHVGKDTFRASNIDSLYWYAFDGKGRNEALALLDNNIQRKQILYYVPDQDDSSEDDSLGGLREMEQINLETTSLQEILAQANDLDQVVHFYINDAILKNKRGASYLVYLLSDNLMRSLIDLDIKFHFDDEVKKNGNPERFNIVTDSGRLNYIKYWKKEKEKYDELREILKDSVSYHGDIQETDKDYESLAGVPFFMTLKALAELQVKGWADQNQRLEFFQKLTTRDFQPFLTNTTHCTQPDVISEIFQISAKDKNLQPCNFLCVIGYEAYYRKKEGSEMLKYFMTFNTRLRDANHHVVRIFTLRARKAERTRWVTDLEGAGNKVLYQYLLANLLTGAETYLFQYDAYAVEPSNRILLYQDYVIRLSKYGRENSHLIDNITQKVIMYEDIYEDENAELYMAYPEDLNGVNQMIRTQNKNSIVRYFEDFRHRIEYLNGDARNHQIERVDKDEIRDLLPLLGLKPDEEIDKIEQEVEKLQKEIEAWKKTES